jgi:tetratricopeptide (TPR) repeat protein
MAMSMLGNALFAAGHYEDALPVQEAILSLLRRRGASEESLLVVQGNLASSYEALGRSEQALQLKRDVYSGRLKVNGEEHEETFRAANNYADSLNRQRRFEEVKPLLRKTIPVARRVLGEGDVNTLRLRWNHAKSLYQDGSATLDDLREAVATYEEIERTARRVLGGAHPLTVDIGRGLQYARSALAARDGDDVRAVCEALRKAEV